MKPPRECIETGKPTIDGLLCESCDRLCELGIYKAGDKVHTPAGRGAVDAACLATPPGGKHQIYYYWVEFDQHVEFLGRTRAAAWFMGSDLRPVI